jgi:hypothetical protein
MSCIDPGPYLHSYYPLPAALADHSPLSSVGALKPPLTLPYGISHLLWQHNLASTLPYLSLNYPEHALDFVPFLLPSLARAL